MSVIVIEFVSVEQSGPAVLAVYSRAKEEI
jgi:hypothetical protein